MRKIHICFFVVSVFLAAAILAGGWLLLRRPRQADPVPGQVMETETAPQDNAVANREPLVFLEKEKPYCLVAEDGFLLVFLHDQENVCLDTHMPLSEFPVSEQERLMEGIWFDTMTEVLSYLESYSS